ncbi:MAG TPA: acyl-CoA dehydrogenase family protein [Acidimicrobiia bacterium]|nr:acyl-CoA dehydrogenase family protein [Acidimicrobiia bacterium]
MSSAATTDDLHAYRLTIRRWLADNVERVRPTSTYGGQRAGETEDEFVARSRALQAKYYDGGYAGITLPKEWGGQGLTTEHQRIFDEEVQGYERPGGFGGTFGPILGALLGHMNEEQRREYLVPILRGTLWCQLMSEPGSGSDIGGITTRAVQDGDEWVINGQKVWTTAGHLSDYAVCLARTDWDVPKYAGLTMFIVPMDTPGVSPRPLRQITGDAEFCETFLDDVRVPTRNVLGVPGGGWSVVQTWLTYEHGGVDEGDQSGRGIGGNKATASLVDAFPAQLHAIARARGVADDPSVRDRLVRVFVAEAVTGLVGAYLGLAMRDGRISSHAGSMVKVAASTNAQQSTALAVDLLGMAGVAWDPRDPRGGGPAREMLQTRSHSIAGGTNEIQRNNVGDRVLGLPREPAVDRGIPFREVRTNVAAPERVAQS